MSPGVVLDKPTDRGMELLNRLPVGCYVEVNDELTARMMCSRNAVFSRVKKSQSFRMATRTNDKCKVIVRVC